mmetsp:Transcript_26436/g.78196  ORF Transcript_26436/g.78196 Transcript_26436/m.78196 type:complete len:145 (-) Transcript_26436:1222-1656(-)
MFDVVALKKISIVSMNVHTTSTSNVTVEVFTKAGSYIGFDKNASAWDKIASIEVQGQGIGQSTPLPIDAFEPVPLDPSEKRSFYVTLTTLTTGDLRYTIGQNLGEEFASNSDLLFLEGAGKSYPFRSTYQPRVWNGVLVYTERE